MLYPVLRAAARVALHWYYGALTVQGADRLPRSGPLILVANHPNALVDALVVAVVLERRLTLTAKATLFQQPVLAWLLRRVGVVPLRRAADERAAARRNDVPVGRNADSFQAVRGALRAGGAVLVFPEGISHDRSNLAPLKSGAARMALDARNSGVQGLHLVGLGLVFERKEAPRSRVLVRVSAPILLDEWAPPHERQGSGRDANDVTLLTRAIEERLRTVTLNFATEERAARAVRMAAALAALARESSGLAHARPLHEEAVIAQRIEAATDALEHAPPGIVAEADRLVAQLESLERALAARGAALMEVRVSPLLRHGAWFVLREGSLALAALPVAALGWITHWPPIRLARVLALHTLSNDPSRDQPAMRTIVLGFGFLLLWYLLQAAVVGAWLGVPVAAAWLLLVFSAARVEVALRDRLARAWTRARTYLALRADPSLRERVLRDVDSLLREAAALERALLDT